jgi:predicted transcriptional regulator
MLNYRPMTNEDRVVEAAMALNDDEKRRAAERILKLVPTYDPALEAAITEGIADIRAGRFTDFDDLIAELEAADRADEAAGLWRSSFPSSAPENDVIWGLVRRVEASSDEWWRAEEDRRQEEPFSPVVERWLEEFKKLSVDEQREVKERFFAEFIPELLHK